MVRQPVRSILITITSPLLLFHHSFESLIRTHEHVHFRKGIHTSIFFSFIMKKIFSISIATVVVVGVAGIIFAQATTTLSIVEKMKAASHDFTLASELNV